MKRVRFKPAAAVSAEQWVQAGRDREARAALPAEKMKRLTIDMPLGLHTRVKTECAASGRKIADVVRDLLDRELPPRS